MTHGLFVWYELATTDTDAAAAFYGQVIGWTVQPMPELSYAVFTTGETRSAGLMTLPDRLRDLGVPPHWLGYVAVDDVDAYAERFRAEGGEVRHPPTDIPGIGRFAVVADPQGAVLALFKGASDMQPELPMMEPGRVGWHELYTSDWPKAFDFYERLFGWSRAEAIDMGPMGTYQLFSYEGASRGGMMNAPGGMPPHWGFYFVVRGIDQAIERVRAAGGEILHGPQEVPGGAWIIQARDPQGAHFALVSATR